MRLSNYQSEKEIADILDQEAEAATSDSQRLQRAKDSFKPAKEVTFRYNFGTSLHDGGT